MTDKEKHKRERIEGRLQTDLRIMGERSAIFPTAHSDVARHLAKRYVEKEDGTIEPSDGMSIEHQLHSIRASCSHLFDRTKRIRYDTEQAADVPANRVQVTKRESARDRLSRANNETIRTGFEN